MREALIICYFVIFSKMAAASKMAAIFIFEEDLMLLLGLRCNAGPQMKIYMYHIVHLSSQLPILISILQLE